MAQTLGMFHEVHRSADFLWNQCDGAMGDAGEWLVRSGDRAADHVLAINYIVGPDGLKRSRGWRRTMYKLMRKKTTPLRICPGFEWLDRTPEHVWSLVYEPPPYPTDWYYDYLKSRCSRVYGPDPRATHPCVLPAMWTLDDDLESLRKMPPPMKTWPLVAVTSGRQVLPGHSPRLDFIRSVKKAGLPLRLFGRGLAKDLEPLGELSTKASALRPSRFALVIENYAEGDQYITEKIWDALLCWCVPLYYGTRAVDKLIPAEAFVRLPDLGEAGLETVKRTLAETGLWEKRVSAMAEARRRALGELRLVEWIKHELAGR